MRLLCFALLLLFAQYATAQDEVERALRVLSQNGLKGKRIRLNVFQQNGTMVLLTDESIPCFAIVAKGPYAPLAGHDGILAYSINNHITRGTRWITHLYDSQLRELAEKKAGPSADALPSVPSLLGNVQWGQGMPLSELCPTDTFGTVHYLAGCGAVAAGMIMNYYQQPADSFQWNAIKKVYTCGGKTTKQTIAASQLLASLGRSLNSRHGRHNTSTYTYAIPMALTKVYGYSPSAQILRQGSNSERLARISDELQNGRPVIGAGGGHFFVIDGQHDGFLHYNMGWWDCCSGWWRTALTADGTMPFDDIVTGITPR